MQNIDLHNYEAWLLDYSEGNLNEEQIVALKSFMLSHPELDIDLGDLVLPELSEENHSADFKNALKKTEETVPDELLLAYLEGLLPVGEKAAFELKLLQDPELTEDLAAFKNTFLIADESETFASAVLVKTEDDLILNNPVIAYLENQLSGSEKTVFEKELKASQQLRTDLAIASKTILNADLSLVYPDKEALKKQNRVIALFSLRGIASMAAAILLLAGFIVVLNTTTSDPVKKDSLSNHSQPLKKIEPALEQRSAELAQGNKEISNPENTAPETLAKQREQTTQQKTIAFVSKTEIAEIQNVEEQPSPGTKKEGLPSLAKVEEQLIKEQKTELASLPDSGLIRKNYLLAADEEELTEESLTSKTEGKKGIWKRAVQLAQQVNKLGVKSVDGQENSENKYRLSFNSFSVEKK